MDDQEKETAQGRPRVSAAAGQALDLQGGVRAGLEGSWVSRSPGDGLAWLGPGWRNRVCFREGGGHRPEEGVQ